MKDWQGESPSFGAAIIVERGRCHGILGPGRVQMVLAREIHVGPLKKMPVRGRPIVAAATRRETPIYES